MNADDDVLEQADVNPKFNLGANYQNKFGPAKSQGNTNACWAFAATAVLEGHTSIANRRYTALSEQETADCTGGSSIARGGFHNKALEAIQRTGHLTTSANLPFDHRDGGACNVRHQNALPFRISGVFRVNGDNGLAAALGAGPVAVGMGFDRQLSAYRGGVYTNTSCMKVQNHAVTAVGYTSSAWIVRNSYGGGWGESGYVRFTRAHQNMCHISSYSYYISTQRREVE